MTNIAFILFGFLLLVVQSVFSVRFIPHPYAPNLLLPLAIYLGVSTHFELVRGAAITFLLGYLTDSFCGSPMGLQTFILTATYMVTRGAGLRLFLRRPLFQVLLTFLAGILSATAALSLRSIFEKRAPFPLEGSLGLLGFLLQSSFTSAALSPFVFYFAGRVETATRPGDAHGVAA